MTSELDKARADLRERQGGGARYDAAAAPARELGWARRGTSYFARLLNDLNERELDEPSAVEGVSRRWIVAYTGLEARLLADLIGRFRAGTADGEPSAGPEPSASSLSDVITLSDRALRNLFAHAVVHLDVEWRDLSETQWGGVVLCGDGSHLALAQTPLLRARTLWSKALDLRAGGRPSDVPLDVFGATVG